MGKLITGLVGIIGALWLGLAGAGLMWWWDHRPAGDPAWAHVDFLWVHWRAPNSLQARLDTLMAAEAAAQAQGKALAAKQVRIGVSVAKTDLAAQAAIVVRYRTIIQKVPTYVTPQDDLRYPLSVGFVRLHDAAALGVDPGSVSIGAGQSDDARSPVESSALATVIAGNYEACHANAQQLTDLQDWVRQQEAANPVKP